MKTKSTLLLKLLWVMIVGLFFAQGVMGQTGVLNYQDPVITYNSASPPAYPPANTLAKWVRTVRFSWNSTEYKCYFYNNVQFRLRFPASFSPTADGKLYPLYLFFHGVGERGSIYDNEQQFAHGGQLHLQATDNGTFDGFLLYPQSAAASGGWSQAQIDAMAQLITSYLVPQVKVDLNRIIVSGLSGGGDAAWTFLETHPTLAAGGFIMSSANINDIQYVPTLKWTPIWLFQGGLDKAPDPSTTIQLVNAYNNAGGNLTYTLFPNDGHDTWDDAWKEPNYFQWLLSIYKSNPWVLNGHNLFCPNAPISAQLGVCPGMAGYQWRRNGSVITGATSNTYTATLSGTYDCSVLQSNGVWSAFSPTPVVVGTMPPTVSPNIQLNGLISDVIPSPDGGKSVSLTVPSGYSSYTWERVDSPAGGMIIPGNDTNTISGITPGQYAVEVTQKFGCSSSFSAPFTVVNANGPNPPSPVTNLLATALSKTSLTLTWNENPAPPTLETQFEIYQGSSTSGPFKLIGYAPALTDSFIAAGLSPNTTYFYEVRPIDNTAAAAVTGPASATTQADVTPPTAPGSLQVGLRGINSIQLLWNASTDDVGVVAYDIYVNGNKTFSVGSVDSATVYDLLDGQTYNFEVKARDFAGNQSPFSNQLTAAVGYSGLSYNYYSGTWTTLPDFNAQVPLGSGSVPNVTLTIAQAPLDYGILWSGYINIPTTGSYTFETTSSDGSKMYIDVPYTLAAPATVSNDNVHSNRTASSKALTLTAGTHTFAATFFKGASGTASLSWLWKTPTSGGKFVAIPNSAFIQNVSVSGKAPSAPYAPGASTVSAKKISVNWSDSSSNVTGFQVYRSTSATGPFVTVATVKPTSTTYGDSSLNPQTTYYYQITAINNGGSSAASATVNTTTQALPPLPAAPSGLTAASQGATHVALSWTNNATNQTGFQVWRSPTNNANYVLAASLPASAGSYVDGGLTNNTLYYYKVLAFNEAGNSGYSNEDTVTTSNTAVSTVTLTPVANQSLFNDSTVTLALTATSSAGVSVAFTTLNLPSFGSLTDNGNGTATLSFRANSSQLGSYPGIVLTATDAFGGTTSESFNVTVTGRNLTTVLVNFAQVPTASAPWNSIGQAPNTGAAITNMKDANGNATTDGITITDNWEGALANGMTTGNNSGVFPDNVMQNFFFGSTANPYTFNVTGLNPSKRYALVFFAGFAWTASQAATSGTLVTNYTVGTQTVTLDPANNTTNTVEIAGITPDNNGNIAVTLLRAQGAGYCLLSALEILQYDVPTSGASLVAPSNLTASGISTSKVQMNWTGSSDARTGFQVWRSTAPNGTFNLIGTVGANVTSYVDSLLPANSTYFYEVREAVSGGQFSGFSNIAGGSVVQFQIDLSLNSQSTFAERAPWNDLNTEVAGGSTLADMLSTSLEPTGVNFNVVRDFQGFNGAVGITTGNNSGVVPDTVMQTFYYTEFGDSAILSVSGLSQTGVYNIGFYAGTTYNALTNTVYAIGNQSVSVNALGNTTLLPFIYGVKPDTTGTITFTMHSTIGYGFLNAIEIQGMPSPDVIGADSLGTSGVIATALRNQNILSHGAVFNAASTVQSGSARGFNNSVGVFPNPFVDNVTVSFDFSQNVGKFALVVVDAAGRVVMKQEFNGVPAGRWTQNLNLSRLSRGTYFIQTVGLPAGETQQAFKLVKTR